MKKVRQIKIHFHYLLKEFQFTDRNRLKIFLLRQFKKNNRAVETINYIFCGDNYLFEINRTYLDHHTYTDIITFELSAPGDPLVADIYISVDRVKENAFRFSKPFKEELHTVIFHGALHLIGYKDKFKAEVQQMRLAEDSWLKEYFVPRGKENQH